MNAGDELCSMCGHPLNKHDPEDGTCDVFSGDFDIGVCQCGRVRVNEHGIIIDYGPQFDQEATPT